MAYKLGDPTAKNFGRLTLNPLKHLDPIGTICMIFFHFGWAKPVPINSRYFKKPRRDMALTAAAGPIMNFILALFGMLVCRILTKIFVAFPAQSDFRVLHPVCGTHSVLVLPYAEPLARRVQPHPDSPARRLKNILHFSAAEVVFRRYEVCKNISSLLCLCFFGRDFSLALCPRLFRGYPAECSGLYLGYEG